ncbi:MAG: NADH-quinone oxidoreductase subunit NuoE [Planctomycetota bacterium]
MSLSADLLKRCQEIIRRYPPEHKRSAILMILHEIQHHEGHLSDASLIAAGELLGMAPAEVLGVCSFYVMFHRQPVGRHHICLCRTLSCALRGSEELQAHLEQEYGLRPGETSKDGRFSLQTVECLGHCGTAPVVEIDETYFENLDVEKLDEILQSICNRSGGRE